MQCEIYSTQALFAAADAVADAVVPTAVPAADVDADADAVVPTAVPVADAITDAVYTTSIMPVSMRSIQRIADPRTAVVPTDFGAKRTARREARRFLSRKTDSVSKSAKFSEK